MTACHVYGNHLFVDQETRETMDECTRPGCRVTREQGQYRTRRARPEPRRNVSGSEGPSLSDKIKAYRAEAASDLRKYRHHRKQGSAAEAQKAMKSYRVVKVSIMALNARRSKQLTSESIL